MHIPGREFVKNLSNQHSTVMGYYHMHEYMAQSIKQLDYRLDDRGYIIGSDWAIFSLPPCPDRLLIQ